MDSTQSTIDCRLPFGKHKDQPLGTVPADYLSWLLRSCKLSSGLRAAVAGELTRRGIEAPPAPPLRRIPSCDRCGDAGHTCNWQEDRAGRRRIRASCCHCGRFLTFPPCIPPFTTEADANASPAPVLDALTQLEDLGVDLASDGRTVWLAGDDWRKVPPDLRAIIRQNANLLARMLGRTKT